jgi:lactoylglutathione lyase
MLYSQLPDADKRGKFHHFCLEVPDIKAAQAILKQRAAKIEYTRPMDIAIGINRKLQMNVYDPDGTRVELMEPYTIDRRSTPPSDAPFPVHSTTQPSSSDAAH